MQRTQRLIEVSSDRGCLVLQTQFFGRFKSSAVLMPNAGSRLSLPLASSTDGFVRSWSGLSALQRTDPNGALACVGLARAQDRCGKPWPADPARAPTELCGYVGANNRAMSGSHSAAHSSGLAMSRAIDEPYAPLRSRNSWTSCITLSKARILLREPVVDFHHNRSAASGQRQPRLGIFKHLGLFATRADARHA